jgi:hypothetical protein
MDRDLVGELHRLPDLSLPVRISRTLDHLTGHYAHSAQTREECFVSIRGCRHVRAGRCLHRRARRRRIRRRRGLGKGFAGQRQASERQSKGLNSMQTHILTFPPGSPRAPAPSRDHLRKIGTTVPMRLEALAGLLANPCAVFLPPLTQLRRAGTDSGSIPPPTEPPERGDEFGRQRK